MTKPFLLGVAGGSGSGKTTVAERRADVVGGGDLALLRLDAYYRDRNHLPFEEREAINYDHPDAFDWPLLLDHVAALLDGIEVQVPVYDFATYQRLPDRVAVAPAPIRSEEHTSELQSLMRISYAVFCLKKKKKTKTS